MTIQRIAAFSDAGAGGNPAGIVIADHFPDEAEMRRIAMEVGYSETAFAMPDGAADRWRVRYFSPESEVPFCGHATIALGAALAAHAGEGRFALRLNSAEITVEAEATASGYRAALQSPPTRSAAARLDLVDQTLALFGYGTDQLDPALPPAEIHAGADHLVLALKHRRDLAAMTYELDAGRALMRDHGLVTIMLVHVRSDTEFDARNAFASGGVLEDPATGAAAAAFAGYLRDLKWRHGNRIEIIQGEDMGAKSRIEAEFTDEPGSSIRVSGSTRKMV
ncbi:MAG: PhzF family phenazine biosynthesis protein [Hoeflea sp.]|uniref:PhzF family phenazine biosynthesis protein n=1 Tax=Hoeflea sp. TaxID=1940281 RepID=UPI001D6ACE4A|nr:PhzF family phenazine biosynthesis protein [Hoeflea sp.]MBU4531813.1 PhzF family phenazine biosynthesis protein [Alphaproteobacteria bacterium]MBU4544669.1 PhzF family phenazine biosynthesis protein [Alphaproteobacteria bacterium]MBU4552900.1 PhzF family phenazine biosynthesis protein [Alphaproteobacteria bacterium]MBV1725089.1 PhzF family phenazine biosynthesis protein [Hoeflea sp.]MBV1761109.1 PhzF family phenazine biosynthesis protein [Hoeflea sp.]